LNLSEIENAPATEFGLYQTYMKMINETSGDTLYRGVYSYELESCTLSWVDLFSENAASVVLKAPGKVAYDTTLNDNDDIIRIDSIYFQLRTNRNWRQRNGSFSSGDFRTRGYCYANNWLSNFRNILGFDFDFSMRQYGGSVRPDTAYLLHAKDECPEVGTTIRAFDSFIGNEEVVTENKNEVKVTQNVSWDYNNSRVLAGSFNNGPGIYKITFREGGRESINMAYNEGKQFSDEISGDVDYLLMDVENVYSYKRSELSGDSVDVSYPGDMEPIVLPIAPVKDLTSFYQFDYTVADDNESPFPKANRFYPDVRNLGFVDTNTPTEMETNRSIGKYNLSAYAYYNIRGASPILAKKSLLAVSKKPTGEEIVYVDSLKGKSMYEIAQASLKGMDVLGVEGELYDAYSGLKQNRYYKSTKIGGKWLDFTHELQVNGCSFSLDYANSYRFGKRPVQGLDGVTKPTEYKDYYKNEDRSPDNEPKGRDFKAGDVIYLATTGGASGFPLPGANVRFVVNVDEDTKNYSEDELDDIKIVPNPYYISHQGQASPYDAKIYFTKLPAKCTISIFTSSGQLVRELENNQSTMNNTGVVEWDLQNQNGVRAQSQPLIAVIETPDGTTTIQNFAIVVGGFKTITQ
jgi:hypothetical protein